MQLKHTLPQSDYHIGWFPNLFCPDRLCKNDMRDDRGSVNQTQDTPLMKTWNMSVQNKAFLLYKSLPGVFSSLLANKTRVSPTGAVLTPQARGPGVG